jgi:hypothetical protein
MKPETEPVAADEVLIRLVFHNRFTDRVPTISPNAFEPRVKGHHPDVDGISMFRVACVAAPEDVLVVIAEDKRPVTGIVLIPYSRLLGLGLSAVPKPIDAVPGHVVVPELNSVDYGREPAKYTDIKLALAEAASENIHRRPVPPEPS